jgi:hypothetical protein
VSRRHFFLGPLLHGTFCNTYFTRCNVYLTRTPTAPGIVQTPSRRCNSSSSCCTESLDFGKISGHRRLRKAVVPLLARELALRSLSAQGFTEKRGQFAFTYPYSHIFRCSPRPGRYAAPLSYQSAPVPPDDRDGRTNWLMRPRPGLPRTIQILVVPKPLPILNWLKINQSLITMMSY